MAGIRNVKIKGPDDSICSNGTVVTTAEGHEIPGIHKIEMVLSVNSTNRATLHLHASLVDVTADAIFSLDSLREMAAEYGYELVALPDLVDVTALADHSHKLVKRDV